MYDAAMNSSISRVVVLDQHLPEELPVQRVEVRRITIDPHTALGAHVHCHTRPEALSSPLQLAWRGVGVRSNRPDAILPREGNRV